jgi:phenylacetaldehyde dehydrogenase
VFARASAGDAVDIDRAVEAARKAFESGPWSSLPPGGRRNLLWKLADAIEANADELATLETKQSGWGRENARDGVEAYTEVKSVSVAL